MNEISLSSVTRGDRTAFLLMAENHFRELDPQFTPHDDWKASYFDTILANPDYRLRWIEADKQRAGFILFGIEKHRFLPRTVGNVFELYVAPPFRRKGAARKAAELAIQEMWVLGPSRIQLEVVEGNAGAAELWKRFGFTAVTQRYVLRREQK